MLNFCKTPQFLSAFFYNKEVGAKNKKKKSGAILRNKTEENYVAEGFENLLS